MLFEDDKPELNITPMVDVMLVLLAIMMVITPALVYEEVINLPRGSHSKILNKKDSLVITIDSKRKILIGDRKFEYKSFADNFMLYAQKLNLSKSVTIKADKNLKYNTVMMILKSVKRAGFNKVSLATDG